MGMQQENQKDIVDYTCLNELLAQFGEMRLTYETSSNPADKEIDCHTSYGLYSDKYPRQVILAAQIECYDIGIVTYGFEYEDAVGIVAKCGIGERSSVLLSLKFGDIIHKYFITNSKRKDLYISISRMQGAETAALSA